MKRLSYNQESSLVKNIYDIFLENNPKIKTSNKYFDLYKNLEDGITEMLEEIYIINS